MHNAVHDCICVRFLVVFVQNTDRQAARQHCQGALTLQPNHLWLLRLQVFPMLCVCLSVLCVSVTLSLLSLESAVHVCSNYKCMHPRAHMSTETQMCQSAHTFMCFACDMHLIVR